MWNVVQQIIDFADRNFLIIVVLVAVVVIPFTFYLINHDDDPLWTISNNKRRWYEIREREYLKAVDTFNNVKKAGEPTDWYKQEVSRLRSLRDDALVEYQAAKTEWREMYLARQKKSQGE